MVGKIPKQQNVHKFCVPLESVPADLKNYYFYVMLKFEGEEETKFEVVFDSGTSSYSGATEEKGFARIKLQNKDTSLNGWNSKQLDTKSLSGKFTKNKYFHHINFYVTFQKRNNYKQQKT